MPGTLRRTAFAGLAFTGLLVLAACSPGEAPPAEHHAVPGGVVEAAIAPDRDHLYPVRLGAGTYLGASVEQRGVDVVVDVLGTDGSPILTVDAPLGAEGAERVCFVAAEPGLYALRLRALASSGGDYALSLEVPRPARDDDRRCLRASLLFQAAEGERLAPEPPKPALAADYERARDLWERSGRPFHAAVAGRQAALVWGTLGDPVRKLDRLRGALQLMRQAGDRRQQVVLLNLLGGCLRRLGRPDESAQAFTGALELARQGGDQRGEATALNNLALIERSRGEVHRALRRYEEALAIWSRRDEPDEAATTLLNAGVAYTVLGRFDDALDTLDAAAALTGADDDRHLQAALSTARGWALYQSGMQDHRRARIDAAIDEYRRAIELGRSLGDRDAQGAAQDRLGTALLELGRLPEAQRAYRGALRAFQTTGNRRAAAHTRANYGHLLLTWERPGAARRELETAHRAFTRLGNQDGLAYVLTGLARLERHQGDLVAARRLIEDALAEIWRVRTSAHQLGAWESPHRIDVDTVELYLDLLLELDARQPDAGHGERAFAVSDLERAYNLHRMLVEAGIRPRAAGARQLRERARQLHTRLDRLAEPAAGGTPAGEGERPRHLRRALRQYAAVRAEIRRREVGFSTSEPAPLSVEEARRLLDADTVIFSYLLGGERSFLLVLGSDFLHRYTLPGRHRIEVLAETAYEALRQSRHRRTRRQATLATAALSDVLLGPATADLDHDRLVILGEEALHLIPFAALPRPGTPSDAVAPRLLIDDHEVVHLPSVSVLAALRRREAARTPARRLLAVVADPVFSRRDPRLADAAEDTAGDATDLKVHFDRLRHSRREADLLASLVPAGQRLMLLDLAASKERVADGILADYRLLHFATHAILHDHPELSGIVLSTVDAAGRPQDGHLRLHDIFTLDLPADLVVLGGCRTALGERIRGDGVLGLTRGFFEAGASRLVVSLWEVPDAATAALMADLYDGILRNGLAPAAALRRAQLRLRRQPRWDRPYFWAGFVLQGDWRPPAPALSTIAPQRQPTR